jgi:hypothetical protein
MARRILITGCPRSGTGYMAALLTRLGATCGHAAHLNPASLELGVPPWPEGLAAEASWYAAPYGESLPAGTVVVHVVRSPAAALSSLWRARLFRTRSVDRAYLERHAPMLLHGTPLQQTARIWTAWNEIAETNHDTSGLRYVRVRLEHLDEAALRWIGDLAEREFDPSLVRKALVETARAVPIEVPNESDALAEWGMLRGSDILLGIDELAARYGYGRAALSGRLVKTV